MMQWVRHWPHSRKVSALSCVLYRYFQRPKTCTLGSLEILKRHKFSVCEEMECVSSDGLMTCPGCVTTLRPDPWDLK